MASSSINPRKKRGRPPVDSDQLNFRVARADLNAIDAAAASEADTPSRPEMVRRIIRDWLIGHGYLPAEPEE